jgi:restriction endonuclease Mrr
VSEPEVRDFYGSFRDEAAHGFFVTTSDFTQQARLWAKDKPIDLVNGEDLVHMIKDFEGSGWYDLLLNKVFVKV